MELLKPIKYPKSKTSRLFRQLLLPLCVGVCLLPMSKAQITQPPLSQNPPLWSASPEQIGYSVSLSSDFNFTVGGDVVRIQFLDGQRVALAWLTPDQPTKPVGRVIHVPCHLHLSVLDAQTGHQLLSHEWPCTSQSVNLAHTASGQWLLANDESVTLYSSSFEKVRDLQHVRLGGHGFVSPSGRTFLSYVSDSQGVWSAQLRDSGTFEALDSWNDGRVAKASFVYSDRFILARISRFREPQQLFIREIGKSWSPFSQPLATIYPTYGFLSNDTLLSLLGDQLLAETVAGQELFRQTVRAAELSSGFGVALATSRGGERFALVLQRIKGFENELIDMTYRADGHVIVYSVPHRSAIFIVKVKGELPWWVGGTSHAAWNRIALSPDGLLLGIVSNKGVRVYALPAD